MSEPDGERAIILTAPLPPLLIRRGLLAPNMLAHVLVQKFRFGMPFFRQEEQLHADSIELDRGTMSRSTEDIGACSAPLFRPASTTRANMHSAFAPVPPESRSARSHFQMGAGNPAEKAISSLFWPTENTSSSSFKRNTPAPPCATCSAASRYIQADAHAIYDALFRGDAVESGAAPPIEVACWSHAP